MPFAVLHDRWRQNVVSYAFAVEVYLVIAQRADVQEGRSLCVRAIE